MYADESYSASKFWDKIASIPKDSGYEIIRKALTLYIILIESETPIWVKTAIVVKRKHRPVSSSASPTEGVMKVYIAILRIQGV